MVVSRYRRNTGGAELLAIGIATAVSLVHLLRAEHVEKEVSLDRVAAHLRARCPGHPQRASRVAFSKECPLAVPSDDLMILTQLLFLKQAVSTA